MNRSVTERAPRVSGIQCVTVGVTDLDAALALFEGAMELRPQDRGDIADGQARAWHLAPEVRARYVELSCRGYRAGRLRLVAYTPQATARVRGTLAEGDGITDVGPKAIDFYVRSPILPMVRRIEALGYAFRSPPVLHVIGDHTSEECAFPGPDGVPILIMVGHDHPPNALRPGSPQGPFSEIATVSIVSGDLDETRRFYGGLLGMNCLVDAETPSEFRDQVNALTGVPNGTRVHFLTYAAKDEPSGKYLFLHFYDRTGKRLADRMRPGRLGFSLLTHTVDDIEALHASFRTAGVSIMTPPTEVARASHAPRQKIMLVRGPNEETLEFVEAAV